VVIVLAIDVIDGIIFSLLLLEQSKSWMDIFIYQGDFKMYYS